MKRTGNPGQSNNMAPVRVLARSSTDFRPDRKDATRATSGAHLPKPDMKQEPAQTVKQQSDNKTTKSNTIVSNVFVHVRPSGSAQPPVDDSASQPSSSVSHYGILKFSSHNQISFSRWSQQRASIIRDIDVRAAAAVHCNVPDDVAAMPEKGEGAEYMKKEREEAKRRRRELSRNKKRVSLQQKIDQSPMLIQLASEQQRPRILPALVHDDGAPPPAKTEKQPVRRRRFRGTREPDAANSAYYVFSRTPQGDWEAFPIEHIFAFKPFQRSTMNDEEVEEQFKRRDKIYNTFAQFAGQRIGEHADEADADGGNSSLRISSLRARKSDEKDDDDTKDTSSKLASSRQKRRRMRRGDDDEESDDGDGEGKEVDYMSDSDEGSVKAPLDEHDELTQLRGLDEEMEEDEADDKEKDGGNDDEKDAEKDEKKEGDKQPGSEIDASASGVAGNNNNNKRRLSDENTPEDFLDENDYEDDGADRPHRSAATAMMVDGADGGVTNADIAEEDDLDKFDSPIFGSSDRGSIKPVSGDVSASVMPVVAGAGVASTSSTMSSVAAAAPNLQFSSDETFIRDLLKRPHAHAQIMEKFSKYRTKIGRPLTHHQVGKLVLELVAKLNAQQLDPKGGKPKFFIAHG